jgi:hypothetical protein
MEAPLEETPQERNRRIARCWYWNNRERIRQKKLDQCHGYRRRLRAGRPPKVDKTIFFNAGTGEMIDSNVRFEEPPKPEVERKVPTAVIESGSFVVNFN